MTSKLTIAVKAMEILQGARDFLAQPGKWTKHEWIIRSGSGYQLPETALRACAIGAVGVQGHYYQVDRSTKWKPHELESLKTLAKVIQRLAGMSSGYDLEADFRFWAAVIFTFNDSRETELEDVLTAFDLAIEEQCKVVQRLAAESEAAPMLPLPEIDSSTWTGL